MQLLCRGEAPPIGEIRSRHARRLRAAVLVACLALPGAHLHAGEPPLLARAIERWNEGKGDLAFTQ